MTTNLQQAPHTISPDGVVPRRRIKNAAEAQSVAQLCIRDNRERSSKIARMKALVDGESPFLSENLRKNGQGYRSNVNPMDAAAHLDAACVPYYDLFATQRYRCEIETNEGGDLDAPRFSRCITEEVDTYLREDPLFESEMRAVIYWRVGYGIGTLLWRDPWTPEFCSISPDKVKVPRLSVASVEKISFFTIEVEYDVVELYRRIEEEKIAKEAGWNPDEVKRAIAAAQSSAVIAGMGAYGGSFDYVKFQQLVKNNEIETASQFKTVKCSRLVWKEFDGTISECIVRMDNSPVSGPEEETKKDFLYVSHGKYKRMSEAVSAFFQDSAEGYWHGATGQLQRTFNVLQLKSRLFNAAHDAAFMRASLTVKASSSNDYEKAQIVQRGNLTVMPPGMEVQNSTIFGDLQSVLGVSQYDDNIIYSNTGVYRSRLDKPTGNPRTAKEVELQYETAAALSNSAVNRFMSELDVFYKEMVRRLLIVPLDQIRGEYREKVKELRNRISDKGVPASAFRNIFRVEASRGLGNGARYLKNVEMQDAMIVFQMLSGRGAENFKLDLLASRYGYRLAKRWADNPLPNQSDELNLWAAQMETALLKDGLQPIITDDQDNFIHSAEHLRVGADAANAVQSGADKTATLAFLHSTGEHVASHINRLSTNKARQGELKQLTQQFIELSKFAEELEKMIVEEQQQQATQAQAQAVQQGVDPDVQLKAAKLQADLVLKKQKQDENQKMREERQKFDQKQRIQRQQFAWTGIIFGVQRSALSRRSRKDVLEIGRHFQRTGRQVANGFLRSPTADVVHPFRKHTHQRAHRKDLAGENRTQT